MKTLGDNKRGLAGREVFDEMNNNKRRDERQNCVEFKSPTEFYFFFNLLRMVG